MNPQRHQPTTSLASMKLSGTSMTQNSENEERIQALARPLWIGYSRAIQIREQMEQLLSNPKMHRMPNIALIGNSNNGKTMLMNNFLRRNSPQLKPDFDINQRPTRPVFMFQAPPEPDEGRMYRRMLTELFADAAGSEREPAEAKLRRVSIILSNLQTRIILIDEFGFFQAGSPVKQRKVLNALKFIGNELQIPMVIAAVPEALNLLQSDEQVANRFEPVFLPRWKMGEDYHRLLASIEKELGLKERSHLTGDEISQRILDESDGIIGNMTTLLQKVATQAIRNGTERISLNDLSVSNLRKVGWTHPSRRHQFPG